MFYKEFMLGLKMI